jgi:FixJ family two-component response regulator
MAEASPLVLVVDDDISMRESLLALIELAGWRVKTFATAREFLAYPQGDYPGCLILDIGLPDLNGLDLQKVITADRTHMPIIFLTGYGDVPKTVRAMKAGAVEFFTKPFDGDVLLNAVATAIVSSRAALELEAELQLLEGQYALLTARERQVMSLVILGVLNKRIGGELGISEITVKAHRGRVMVKMKAGSVAELVNMGARLGPTPAAKT